MPTHRRFPRLLKTDDSLPLLLWFQEFRQRYPPPRYNEFRDGGWNPGEGVAAWLIGRDIKQLRKLCRKHALEPSSKRKKCIKRLYLHWRASKLMLAAPGFEYYGYGEGFENVDPPRCACGRQKIPKRFPRILKPTNCFLEDIKAKPEEDASDIWESEE